MQKIFLYLEIIGYFLIIGGNLFFSKYSPLSLAGFWIVFFVSIVLLLLTGKYAKELSKANLIVSFTLSIIGIFISISIIYLRYISLN